LAARLIRLSPERATGRLAEPNPLGERSVSRQVPTVTALVQLAPSTFLMNMWALSKTRQLSLGLAQTSSVPKSKLSQIGIPMHGHLSVRWAQHNSCLAPGNPLVTAATHGMHTTRLPHRVGT